MSASQPVMMVQMMPMMQVQKSSESGDAAFSQAELEKRLKKAARLEKKKAAAEKAAEEAPPPPELDQPPPPESGSDAHREDLRSAPSTEPLVERDRGMCVRWNGGVGHLRSEKHGDIAVRAHDLMNCAWLKMGDTVTFELGPDGNACKCLYTGGESRGTSLMGDTAPPPPAAAPAPTPPPPAPASIPAPPLDFKAEGKPRDSADSANKHEESQDKSQWASVRGDPLKGSNKVCNWCGQRGHIMANCTTRGPRSGPKDAPSSGRSKRRSSSSSSSSSRSRRSRSRSRKSRSRRSRSRRSRSRRSRSRRRR